MSEAMSQILVPLSIVLLLFCFLFLIKRRVSRVIHNKIVDEFPNISTEIDNFQLKIDYLNSRIDSLERKVNELASKINK